MTITLTREEAQDLLAALEELNRLSIGKDAICLPAEIDDAMEILEARLAQLEPEPQHRDVVIKGDLWRIEFLPDHAASVVLVEANYEAQPEPPCKTGSQCIGGKCPQCVVPEPVGWIYEDDEGRMMFSQMPTSGLFWEPVYRKIKGIE